MTPTSQKIVPLKIGLTGEMGVGKTTTAALIAAALSVQFHDRAPVWVTDPELGWQFFPQTILRAEKIELVQRTVPTFKAMMQDIRDAERAGACVYNVEGSKIWIELVKTVQKNCGDRWGMELNSMWTDFVNFFMNSKMHCDMLGRVGEITEEVMNDQDELKRIKIGEGMKVGGQRNQFGYEPHLFLRMTLERRARRKSGRDVEDEGRMVHRAETLKDRTSALNGKIVRWTDMNGYKPGGYMPVWNFLKPHFAAIQSSGVQPTLDTLATSSEMVDNGKSEFSRQMTEKEIALEKFDALLRLMWGGETAVEKQLRRLCEFNITGTLSRTEFATLKSVLFVKWSAKVMDALRARVIEEGAVPMTEKDLISQLDSARQDVATAEKYGDEAFRAQQTLMQNKLEGSLAAARKGPLAFREQTARTAAEMGD